MQTIWLECFPKSQFRSCNCRLRLALEEDRTCPRLVRQRYFWKKLQRWSCKIPPIPTTTAGARKNAHRNEASKPFMVRFTTKIEKEEGKKKEKKRKQKFWARRESDARICTKKHASLHCTAAWQEFIWMKTQCMRVFQKMNHVFRGVWIDHHKCLLSKFFLNFCRIVSANGREFGGRILWISSRLQKCDHQQWICSEGKFHFLSLALFFFQQNAWTSECFERKTTVSWQKMQRQVFQEQTCYAPIQETSTRNLKAGVSCCWFWVEYWWQVTLLMLVLGKLRQVLCVRSRALCAQGHFSLWWILLGSLPVSVLHVRKVATLAPVHFSSKTIRVMMHFLQKLASFLSHWRSGFPWSKFLPDYPA